MKEFLQRNFIWLTISLAVIGVILSIAGIPTHQPLLFFVGVVCALPTVAYLIYEIFFARGKEELNFRTINGKRVAAGSVAVVDRRENILLEVHEPTVDDDFDYEPLYNGYATEPEIDFQLQQILNDEQNRAQVAATTAAELSRERERAEETPATTPTASEPVIPVEDVPAPTPVTVDATVLETTTTLETPTTEAAAPAIPEVTATEPAPAIAAAPTPVENPLDEASAAVLAATAARQAERQQKAAEKKAILAQENLEKYFQHYFIETATCFLLDRNIYKDSRGIAPYNKLTVEKTTGLPEFEMSATKGKLYKFCTYLPDMERFITHPQLYADFVTAVEQGIPLVRISETLHPLYRKKYKKDFVLNYLHREDWDNIIILVFNNYILDNDNFKDVFTRVPFTIPTAYNEQNVTDYLADPDIQARFLEKFPTYNEIGIPTFWEALYICFINSIKEKLPLELLETALLKDYKKIARALKRADKQRQKQQKQAS